MSDFLKDIIKQTGNEYATIASEGTGGDVDNFIDTGSYSFNALLSGSIYGGLPDSRITAIAGEAATGKTFFALGIVKAFLDRDPNAGVIYFESESAVSKSMVESRGIDSKRLVVMPVSTVQEFRTQSIKVAEKYLEQDKSERKPIMFVLDSLGMLSTTKEMDDTAAGKETRDMTRSQIVKSTFRVLTLKLGQAGIPMIMQAMLSSLDGQLRSGPVVHSHSVRAYTGESQIADALSALQDEFAEVDIGSYPFFRDERYGTILVIRGIDTQMLANVAARIMAAVATLGETPEDMGLTE